MVFFVCIDLYFELNIACHHSIKSPRLTFILTYHHHHRVRMPGGSLSPTDCATGTPPPLAINMAPTFASSPRALGVTADPRRSVGYASAPAGLLRTPAALTSKLFAKLKATPAALGSAVISEHISTLGVGCVNHDV